MSAQTIERPSTTETTETPSLEGFPIKFATTDDPDFPWMLKALNNEITTFDEAIEGFMEACSVDEKQAGIFAREIHEQGSSIVLRTSKKKCEKAQKILLKYKIQSEIIEA
jgi:ATP-dependent Clp protease adapter protein ClpS